MTLKQLFENYLGFLWETFLFDIEVYSNEWVWWALLIPAIGYTIFFVIKWALLLLPFYFIPLLISKTIIVILANNPTHKPVSASQETDV